MTKKSSAITILVVSLLIVFSSAIAAPSTKASGPKSYMYIVSIGNGLKRESFLPNVVTPRVISKQDTELLQTVEPGSQALMDWIAASQEVNVQLIYVEYQVTETENSEFCSKVLLYAKVPILEVIERCRYETTVNKLGVLFRGTINQKLDLYEEWRWIINGTG